MYSQLFCISKTRFPDFNKIFWTSDFVRIFGEKFTHLVDESENSMEKSLSNFFNGILKKPHKNDDAIGNIFAFLGI